VVGSKFGHCGTSQKTRYGPARGTQKKFGQSKKKAKQAKKAHIDRRTPSILRGGVVKKKRESEKGREANKSWGKKGGIV